MAENKPRLVTAKITGKYNESVANTPNWMLDSNFGLPVTRISGFFFTLDNGRQQTVSKEEFEYYQVGNEYEYEETDISLTAFWLWLVGLLLFVIVLVVIALLLLPPS
jgi:hypothetical protein